MKGKKLLTLLVTIVVLAVLVPAMVRGQEPTVGPPEPPDGNTPEPTPTRDGEPPDVQEFEITQPQTGELKLCQQATALTVAGTFVDTTAPISEIKVTVDGGTTWVSAVIVVEPYYSGQRGRWSVAISLPTEAPFTIQGRMVRHDTSWLVDEVTVTQITLVTCDQKIYLSLLTKAYTPPSSPPNQGPTPPWDCPSGYSCSPWSCGFWSSTLWGCCMSGVLIGGGGGFIECQCYTWDGWKWVASVCD